MKVTDFYNAVARKADTDTTKINAAEVRRVLATAFEELSSLPAAEAMDVVAKAMVSAAKRKKKK